MRSHSIFEQLDSLSLEELKQVKAQIEQALEFYHGKPKEGSRQYKTLLDTEAFADIVKSVSTKIKREDGLIDWERDSGAFLKAILPGIFPFVEDVRVLLVGITKSASDSGLLEAGGDELVPLISCLASKQNMSADELFKLEQKAGILEEIVSLIELDDYAYAASTFCSGLRGAATKAAEEEEKKEEVAEEPKKYALIVDSVVRMDLERAPRNNSLDTSFSQTAREILVLEPNLADLRNAIRTYQDEEIETLRKLLKEAGPEFEGAYTEFGRTGALRDESKDRPKTMKEIIDFMDEDSIYHGDIKAGKHKELKKVADKCRFFVKCDHFLNDRTQTVAERVSNLQVYVQAPENVKIVEEHRRRVILDCIIWVLTLGKKGGYHSHSDQVMKNKINPELGKLDRFFKQAPPQAGVSESSAQQRPRVDTQELPSDPAALDGGAAVEEKPRRPSV